jgi:glycosyltransferase involved in cell wall biosynthesis
MHGFSSFLRLLPSQSGEADPLRIAMLAPPWIPVPPLGYGGIEAVVALLCEALVERGHQVTLFAAPGSRSAARVYPLLEDAHPNEIGASLYESDHVAGAWAQIDLAAEGGLPFDVMHDHSGFTALAMADRVAVPVVHTIHGPFDRHTAPFYRRHGHKARLVAISSTQAQSAPVGVRIAGARRRGGSPQRRWGRSRRRRCAGRSPR